MSAFLILSGVALVLWYLSAGNDDAVRALTDDELRDEIDACYACGEPAHYFEAELARRVELDAR